MKKLLLFLVILSLILTVNVAFAENETVSLNETDIYVSNDGSDSFGNGSIDNPYQTLNYTIEVASNNSNIYLKSGTYNSTGYEIKNKSISITGLGEVTIDGLNGNISQNIFKINNGSSLYLNNIRFINGYADLDGTLSCIVNQGQLFINNSTFDNFRTAIGVIRNDNYLYLNNVSSSNLFNVELFGTAYKFNMYIKFIYNVAYCDIYNSYIGVSYNNKDMNIINSYIERFISNKEYSNQKSYAYFDNSTVYVLTVSDCDEIIFNNSYIFCDYDIYERPIHSISTSNISMFNTTFTENFQYKLDGRSYQLRISNSSFTAISSNILIPIIFESSVVSISYSYIKYSILSSVVSNVDVNYNWWGDNKGPKTSNDAYSSLSATFWIVLMVENQNSTFIADLTKYTNGVDIWNLDSPSKLPSRLAIFESESGEFQYNTGYLKYGKFKSDLFNNNNDTMVYITIDNQVLRVVVGEGNSNFSWYVSDSKGNDYFNDGSYENPYKTLKKATSQAVSGNIIYVLPGNYTLSWNANLQISKNLTYIGIGDALLQRPNARSIFVVDAKGILNIENLTFTNFNSKLRYYEPLIHLTGGNVNIKNSKFYNIITKGVILSDNSDYINVYNSTFDNVEGCVIAGNSTKINLYNSKILNGLGYSWYYGYYYACIAVSSNLLINNCTFNNNNEGTVWLDPYNSSDGVCTIYNSTFSNNGAERNYYCVNYPSLKLGNTYAAEYSLVDGCTFYNNVGNLLYCKNINNSIFINNTRVRFDSENVGSDSFPTSVIYSNKIINNSFFYNNSFISKSYQDMLVHSDEVYYSTFIKNQAGFGGALSNVKEVHYSIFVNNSATYGGNDIFNYKGDLNCSSNWWGSNQMPLTDRIQVFIGTLILEDWVIMTIEYEKGNVIASLNHVLDINESIYSFDKILPSRNVSFLTEGGILSPYLSVLINNEASTKLIKNSSEDFDVFAQIDNQIVSLTIYNNSTQILVKNLDIHGKDVLFNISLINVNGHRISNQDLNVVISKENIIIDSFILTTNSIGDASFNVDYSLGKYDVNVFYYGNGYFEKSNSSAIITISSIGTRLLSHNYTFSGKNNKYYAILSDNSGRPILNQTLVLKVFDLKNNLIRSAQVKTGNGGRADVTLSLDVGTYKIFWDYQGTEWYEKSHVESIITISPVETNIILLDATLYGRGDDYKFLFNDIYGNSISNELIKLIISKGNESQEFSLTTDNGVASITINLLPGIYNLKAIYNGDEVYGPASATATLNVEPVFVTLDFNSYQLLPEKGVFTTILKDMYGRKVSGENITLNVINKDIQRIYKTVTDANGEANFIVDAPEDIYFAIINYEGSTWFRPVSSAATIEIRPNVILNNVYINGSDFIQYYGENKYYIIDFNDTNAYTLEGKIINTIISADDWSRSYNLESNVFGQAKIQITLEPGIYNISYSYKNEYYNLHADGSSTITIYQMPTSLIASNMIMKTNENRNFEVKLVDNKGNPLPNLPVTISVDGKNYKVITNQNGIAKLLIKLDLGLHNISYSFNNKNYIKSNGNAIVLVVNDTKTSTNLMGYDVIAREDQLINYTVLLSDLLNNPISSSEITLNIFDIYGNNLSNFKSVSDDKGFANFNFNLNHGEYLMEATYYGNVLYLPSFTNNYLQIKPLENLTETILFGNDLEIINGENNFYSVVLTDKNGNFINNTEIEFVVKGYSYFTTTDDEGRAYLKVLFAPGSYDVLSKFNGSNNLTESSIRNYISVYGELVYLYSRDVVKSFNNQTQYYVALYDVNNEPLFNKIITFKINNKTYQNVTDIYGFACFEVNLSPGEYIVDATYQGEYPDEFITVSNNITVLGTIFGENLTKYYGDKTELKILLLNNINQPLENKNIDIIINGKHYLLKTDLNGILTVKSLNLGKNEVICVNPLSNERLTFLVNIKSTISATNLIKFYKGSSKFSSVFRDYNGVLLKNTKVKFIINKKTYIKTTNSEGVVNLVINLKPGKYSIKIYNLKTGEVKTSKITIKSLIVSKNKNVKVNKNINYNVKIFKSNGKIAKKVTIRFIINKKSYKIRTNNKGIAKLNIKLKNKGKYTITTSYNGLSVKNKIIVK